MRQQPLRAGGAAMGQRGFPHSLKAPTKGAGNPLVSHIIRRFNNHGSALFSYNYLVIDSCAIKKKGLIEEIEKRRCHTHIL